MKVAAIDWQLFWQAWRQQDRSDALRQERVGAESDGVRLPIAHLNQLVRPPVRHIVAIDDLDPERRAHAPRRP